MKKLFTKESNGIRIEGREFGFRNFGFTNEEVSEIITNSSSTNFKTIDENGKVEYFTK